MELVYALLLIFGVLSLVSTSAVFTLNVKVRKARRIIKKQSFEKDRLFEEQYEHKKQIICLLDKLERAKENVKVLEQTLLEYQKKYN
jgi:hypothetical protein